MKQQVNCAHCGKDLGVRETSLFEMYGCKDCIAKQEARQAARRAEREAEQVTFRAKYGASLIGKTIVSVRSESDVHDEDAEFDEIELDDGTRLMMGGHLRDSIVRYAPGGDDGDD